MSESDKDDWAMTRINLRRPSEPIEESFDHTIPNIKRPDMPEIDDWAVRPQSPRPQQPPVDFDKTYIPAKKPASGDWDLTQANIKIPKNDVVNFNTPSAPQDDWGMTKPHIDSRHLDMDFSSVSPPRSESIGMPRSGMTQIGSPVPREIKPPPVLAAEVSPQKQETSNVNKWLYFVAGAFTMFIFMSVFLAAVYLIFLFK